MYVCVCVCARERERERERERGERKRERYIESNAHLLGDPIQTASHIATQTTQRETDGPHLEHHTPGEGQRTLVSTRV